MAGVSSFVSFERSNVGLEYRGRFPVADTGASLFVKMSDRPSRAAAVAAVEKSRAGERAAAEAMERLNETDPLTDDEVESSEGTEGKESEEEEQGSEDDEEEEDSDLEIDDVSDDGSVVEVGLSEEEVGADEVPAEGDENASAGTSTFAEALSVLLSFTCSSIERDGKLTVAAAASVISRAWDLAGGLAPDQGLLQDLLPGRVEHRILELEEIPDAVREQTEQYVPGRAQRELAMAGGGERVRAAGFSSNNSNVVDGGDSENAAGGEVSENEDNDKATRRALMDMVENGTLVFDEATEWSDEKEAARLG